MNFKATLGVDPVSATVLPSGHTVDESTVVWPWLALSGVVFILFVIARFARKRLPFGRHL
jgi:hypothetical protein